MLQFNDIYVIVCLLCTEIFLSSFIIAIITMTLVFILIHIISIIKKKLLFYSGNHVLKNFILFL
jgi:hypothetical protein